MKQQKMDDYLKKDTLLKTRIRTEDLKKFKEQCEKYGVTMSQVLRHTVDNVIQNGVDKNEIT